MNQNWESYSYLSGERLPSPALLTKLINPWMKKLIWLPMLIDTGASRSALPLHVLKYDLGLCYTGKNKAYGFYGGGSIFPIFVVDIQIPNQQLFTNVEAFGVPTREFGILGRDVLSQCILTCDGPNRRFRLECIQ